MGMGNQDMGDHFPFKGAGEGGNMLFIQWAWINNRDLALADDIGAGAMKGKGARVIGNDPPD